MARLTPRRAEDSRLGFGLTIDLGSATMQTEGEIAAALRSVADELTRNGGLFNFAAFRGNASTDVMPIVDAHGARVGEWSVGPREAAP
jgi:hypothetical protein